MGKSQDKRRWCTSCDGTGYRKWDGNLSNYNKQIPCWRGTPEWRAKYPNMACYDGRIGPPEILLI